MARTLKYAILGMLNCEKMSGYDLMNKLEFSLGEFWRAKHSQIYPELKKLSDEEMIGYDVKIVGNVQEKKVYYITDEGRKDFYQWLNKDEKMIETPKDVFKLRLFFAGKLDSDSRRKLLKSQLKQHQERLMHLKNNIETYENIPDRDSEEIGDYMVLLGAVMREDTNCKWLKKCLEMA